MALNKYKLGELIEPSLSTNNDLKYGVDNVKGISIKKAFIETKVDMEGVSLSPYLLVKPNYFCYVPITSRNGEKISIAFNDSNSTYIVSSSYIVFYVKDTKNLHPEYLYIYFNRPEFDRYARFNSWGSAREAFSWQEMCDIDIELPPIEIQQQYVDIYKSMVANQKSYESGLNDLKLLCDAYIKNNVEYENYKKIGDFITLNEKRNLNKVYGKKEIRGFDVNGEFIQPMRVFSGDISTFRVISKGDFVYNPRIPNVTFPIALNRDENFVCLVSPAYVSFNISCKEKLNSDYMLMILQNEDFSRKVLYHTWGSSTPFLRHDSLCEIKIPIPDIEVQQAIADIYKVYTQRKQINEKLKAQIKDICPILIRGSLQ